MSREDWAGYRVGSETPAYVLAESGGGGEWWRALCFVAMFLYRLVIFTAALVFLFLSVGMVYLLFGAGIIFK